MGNNAYDIYLDAIKNSSGAAALLFADVTSIVCRYESAMYSREDDLDIGVNTVPVAYTVGQQHIESIPDANQSSNSVGKDVFLSSFEFTPAKQYNVEFSIPTFSYSLFNFDRLESDYGTIEELSAANDLSGNPPSEDSLSAFDILIRHKQEHPLASEGEPAETQAMARLEYLSLSAILSSETVDSKLSTLQLSSIAELVDTDPDTGKDTVYHQLYGFDSPGMGTFALSDQNDFEIVVRDFHTTGGNGARVNYVNLSTLVEEMKDGLSVKVDSVDGGLSSIGYDADNRLEIYNFSLGNRVEKDDKFDIIVRDNENGKVDYTPLSALGSGYPGPWEITINEQTGDATFTNCVAKVARAYHFFQDQSANVGGGDKMVYFVMTHNTSPSVHMYVGNYSNAASLLGGTDANCISASITPLYRITDNKVTCDYRYMLNIQAYDNRNFSTTMYY